MADTSSEGLVRVSRRPRARGQQSLTLAIPAEPVNRVRQTGPDGRAARSGRRKFPAAS